MQKILVLDDSKLIRSMLEQTIKARKRFQGFYASDFASARELMQEHKFFVAVVDLELPDSMNLEALDYVLEQKIPTVVLTATIDKKVRAVVKQKRIVDYIVKNSQADIESTIHIAEKLLYFKNKKALIVDDSKVAQMLVRAYLDDLLFKTICFDGAEAALEYVRAHDDVSLIVTDHQMQGMNGLEFVQKVRKLKEQDETVIIATTGAKESDLLSKFLKFGVDDFISKPIMKEEFNNRIISAMRSQEQLEHISEYVQLIDSYVITSSTDERAIIQSVSDAFCQISGYSREELVGKNHNIVRHPDMSAGFFKQMWQKLKAGEVFQGEIKNRKKDGSAYWVDSIITPNFDFEGNIEGYTAIRIDITGKKIAEEMAITDRLTQVYNRLHLDKTLQEEYKRFERYQHPCTVILFDIDKFKDVNDTYGHLVGDQVLIDLALVVKKVLRQTDVFGRWGGEEFLVICPDTQALQGKQIAEKLRQCIQKHPFAKVSNITCSFGVSEFHNGEKIEEMVKRADDMLYTAKESGRNCVKTALNHSVGL